MNKNIIRLFKDGLRGKIRVELVAFRPKTYSYLIDDDSEHKKVKETKKCVIKTELKFKNEIIWKLQQRFKSEAHNVYAEQINKFVLSSNDDKRLQTFDRITTYPYWTNAFKVCKSEMLSKYKWLILMIMPIKTK